ncbi:MAG: NADP-dependent isocitrate dehydrogenase, partial [Spirochaetia bacterium]
MTFTKITVPDGDKIVLQEGRLQVTDRPIIAFIEGDGTGPDIWTA